MARFGRDTARTSGATVLIVLGLLSGCTRVSPDAPFRQAPPIIEDSTLTTLRVPFRLPLGDISRLVDDVFPDSLAAVRDQKVRKGVLVAQLDLDVTRPRPVWVRARRQYLITSVPLRARGRLKIDPGIRRPFESDFVVHLRTTLSAATDWSVSSNTSVSYTWITEPYFTILGFKIDLKDQATDELERQISAVGPQIDVEIERALDLRSVAEDVWTDLATPIALGGEPPAWLVLHPADVRYTPLTSRGDTVEIGLAMQARVQTVFGEAPKPLDMGPLPVLGRTERSGYDLSLRIPISIRYEDAARMIRPHLLGQRFPIGERVHVRFSSFDLYPSGGVLVAPVDFKAEVRRRLFAVEGRVYFEAIPRFDSLSQAIVFDSLDYDVASRNALAHAADWMLHDEFLNEVHERLYVPLDTAIILGRASVERALRGQPLGRHVILEGRIDDARVQNLELHDDHIRLNVQTSGSLEAKVRDIMRLRRPG